MTAQRWEHVRTLKEVPIDVWFEYYRDCGGTLQYESAFARLFGEIISRNTMIKNSKGNLVQVNFATALNRLYEYYNNKFD